MVARIVSGEGARGQLASEHGPHGPPLWALLGASEEQGPHVWVLEGSLPAWAAFPGQLPPGNAGGGGMASPAHSRTGVGMLLPTGSHTPVLGAHLPGT